MEKEQNTKTENGSQSAGVVDRFTDKRRGKPREPREAIIESLKILQQFKNAEYEKDKIELLFSLFIKTDKGKSIKIITTFDGRLDVAFGRAGHTCRGMTHVRAFCGCDLLINTDYLTNKLDNHQAIRHSH